MKHYSLLVAVLFFSIGLNAQDANSASVNLYGGYTFSDRVDFDFGYGKVKEGFEYGLGVEYFVESSTSVELKYLRMDTDMPFFNLAGTQINGGDIKGALNYILLGGTHYFGKDEDATASPFLGAGLGVGIIETPQSGSDTNFAWDLKMGVKIRTDSAVSVNLQAYLQSMLAADGYSYYWSYYGPIAVTDYVSTYQFGLGAVLSFNVR